MKIIKEIEKSRLTEESLNELKGGIGENCSAEAIFENCGKKYSFSPCAMYLACGSQYYYCTGAGNSQKETCLLGYWVECPQKYHV